MILVDRFDVTTPQGIGKYPTLVWCLSHACVSTWESSFQP